MEQEKQVLRTVLDVVPMRRRVEFGDSYIWVPGLDNDSFELADTIEEALVQQGISHGTRRRASHGIRIDVPDAFEASPQEIMNVMWDVIGQEEATHGEYP
jgi:hypothetical protein